VDKEGGYGSGGRVRKPTNITVFAGGGRGLSSLCSRAVLLTTRKALIMFRRKRRQRKRRSKGIDR
jgi:hypothetical protein